MTMDEINKDDISNGSSYSIGDLDSALGGLDSVSNEPVQEQFVIETETVKEDIKVDDIDNVDDSTNTDNNLVEANSNPVDLDGVLNALDIAIGNTVEGSVDMENMDNAITDNSNTDSNVEDTNNTNTDTTAESTVVEKTVEVLNFTDTNVDANSKNVNQNSYNDSSIRSLKASERVRRRPGVMFGTDDINGAFHTLKEVVGNSLDEARAGYGKDIYVTLHKDKAFTVRDNGRGVPMGWNEDEGRYNWDLIFNELYAGGKYADEGSDESVYEESVGLNGLGVASTQYTSEYMNVISYREDVISKKNFIKGSPDDEDLVVIPNTTGEIGTMIKWKVDPMVFTDTNFTFKMVRKYCESQAHLEGVNFHLYDEANDERVVIEGKSIAGYLQDKVGNKALAVIEKSNKNKGVERTVVNKEGDVRERKFSARCNVALIISEEMDTEHMYFHNSAEMSVGVHAKAFNDALNKFFKDIGKQNDVSITSYDYKDYLNIIVSSYSNADAISYANQTKTGVSNKFIYDIIFNTVLDILDESKAKGLGAMNTLIDKVVNSAYARKKAKELEAQLKAVGKATKGKKPSKMVDCQSNNPKEKELFIVEGDSAKIACKVARDASFQAIIPVKGKTLNCLKTTLDKILNNDEIQDLIGAIGTGIEVAGTDISMFNEDDCNFRDIIICTDADVDGYQIRVLLFTFFYKFMPTLLKHQRVFVAETPLFEIVINSKESIFAYTVEEKDELLAKLEAEGKKYKRINRSKGLGENDPDMLWKTTMCPETRRLTPLTIDANNPMVRAVVNMLFGNDPNKERKKFIFSMLEEGLEDIIDTVNTFEDLDILEEEMSDENDNE